MGESMWLRSMIWGSNTHRHTHTHTAGSQQPEGNGQGLVVAHQQHHGQRLTHRSPIRAAVTRQPVSQTLRLLGWMRIESLWCNGAGGNARF